MKREELSLIKEQMNDLFKAHKQMSGIYKDSTIKLLSRIIDKEFIFENPIEISFRGKTMIMSSIISESESYVKIRGSWACCSGSSCSLVNEPVMVDLYFLSPDEVILIAEEVLKEL